MSWLSCHLVWSASCIPLNCPLVQHLSSWVLLRLLPMSAYLWETCKPAEMRGKNIPFKKKKWDDSLNHSLKLVEKLGFFPLFFMGSAFGGDKTTATGEMHGRPDETEAALAYPGYVIKSVKADRTLTNRCRRGHP